MRKTDKCDSANATLHSSLCTLRKLLIDLNINVDLNNTFITTEHGKLTIELANFYI